MDLLQNQIKDKSFRIAASKVSFEFFCMFYMSHYISHPFSERHKLAILDLQNDEEKRISWSGFRESAKSAIVGLFFPLWCIVSEKYHFFIFLSEDAKMAAEKMMPIIQELQSNKKIIADFGQLYFEQKTAFSQFKKKAVDNFETANGIKFLSKGMGQSIRGLRYKQYRPEICLPDDLQSAQTLRNKTMRDRDEQYIRAELMSGMDVNGRIIMVGNMQHNDCLMARAKHWEGWKNIFMPIMEDGIPTWPERYVCTDKEADEKNAKIKDKRARFISIEAIKKDKGSLVFNQEYMLQPMNTADQIIKLDWINYYEDKDIANKKLTKIMYVDPAVKEKEDSDYTAIAVIGFDDENHAYVLDTFNQKLSFDKIINTTIDKTFEHQPDTVILEDVAAQYYLFQELVKKIMQVKAIKPKGTKRERLMSASHLFENGRVFFKRNQTLLIEQIVNFGATEHDDLQDAVIGSLIYRFIKARPRLFNKRPKGL